MDRDVLLARLEEVRTPLSFLKLLNEVKRLDEESPSSDYWTLGEMQRFASPWLGRRYTSFTIPKKSGGVRLISAPARTKNKVMLRYVNQILKALYTPNEYAMGFVPGRSVAHNAAIHIGQNYVYNIDLKDFFPTITEGLIRKRLQAKPYSLPPEIAKLIAGLATMRIVEMDMVDGSTQVRYVLPQGSPISPILTNMICERLDRRLGGLSRRFGLKYSRYADDITFSSMHYVYHKESDFVVEMRRIIADLGFEINEKKVRLQKRTCRQEVTGVVVSNKINVPRDYVRNIRNLLYIWERYGYEDAAAKFYPKYKEDKGHIKKGVPQMSNVLSGKILYLKMIKGDQDPVYIKLQRTFEYLMERDFATKPSADAEDLSQEVLDNVLEDLSLSLDELLR